METDTMLTICMTPRPVRDPNTPGVDTAFLAVLPRVAAVARFAFRGVRCPETRADRVAEAVALAWKKFVWLSARRKDPSTFATTLAARCCQAVRAGRRLARAENPKDVLSPLAQVRRGFRVERLPARERALGGPRLPPDLRDALADDRKGRVPELAAFRVDYPAWRSGLGRRHRRVLDALAAGGRTAEVAAAVRVSPGRVSQMRREFEQSWRAFHAGAGG
jgi:DNA-directed RNA polymerase specialized sigma24 family protein